MPHERRVLSPALCTSFDIIICVSLHYGGYDELLTIVTLGYGRRKCCMDQIPDGLGYTFSQT